MLIIGTETLLAGSNATIEFNRDIRPILSDACFACHGPDEKARKADLRLDIREGAFADRGGTTPVAPGRPADSELYLRLMQANPDDRMPPQEEHRQLSGTEIELIKQWILQGGVYEGHWSTEPLPENLTETIDQVIQTDLDKVHLQFSPQAKPHTLIRRLSLDLTGLPPQASDVIAFEKDPSPEAYEKLVTQYLNSHHYGERMAVHWLDLVRYADTVGYHGDQNVSMSPFRDYVIRSFNDNLSWPRFTREQLAGDLLENPTVDQKVASGYNRLNMMSAEGGLQPKEYLAKYATDRVSNLGSVWLGGTLMCCECHDHKFDEYKTQDFYSLQAFFSDITEKGLYAREGRRGDFFGTSVPVPTTAQASRLKQLEKEVTRTRRQYDIVDESLRSQMTQWEHERAIESPVAWQIVHPTRISSAGGAKFDLKENGHILVKGKSPDIDTYTLDFSVNDKALSAIRLMALPHDGKASGRAGNGNFVVTEIELYQINEGDEPVLIPLHQASATFEQKDAAKGNPWKKWAAAAVLDTDEKGGKWGWAVLPQQKTPHNLVTNIESAIHAEQKNIQLRLVIKQNHGTRHTLASFRIATGLAPKPLIASATHAEADLILAIDASIRSDKQNRDLIEFYKQATPKWQKRAERRDASIKKKEVYANSITRSLVTVATQSRSIRILPRGNWMDDSGDVVSPAIPQFLGRIESSGDKPTTRMELAAWLTSSDNPLGARSFTNRIWALFFGRGIAASLDDLGSQGKWPTHVHLLNTLASQFQASGGNIKALIKTIVLSRAYQQSSQLTSQLKEVDPDNLRFARQNYFRIDAEFIRDTALSVSGLLIDKVGGVSVRPYQPPGYYAHLNFPKRSYKASVGDDQYRRGVYTHWQRQFLHPAMKAFDAPSRETCTAVRPRSNTPLASLVLLNDPSYFEAAEALAALATAQAGDFQSRITWVYRRVLARHPRDTEIRIHHQLYQKHWAQYHASQSDDATLQAWTSVARTLLNLHETITRY